MINIESIAQEFAYAICAVLYPLTKSGNPAVEFLARRVDGHNVQFEFYLKDKGAKDFRLPLCSCPDSEFFSKSSDMLDEAKAVFSTTRFALQTASPE